MTKQELLKKELTTGGTVKDFLNKLPERWRAQAISGIYECLRQNWPIQEANIQTAALDLLYRDAKEKNQSNL